MGKSIVNLLKFLLFLTVGLSILYLVYRSQNANYLIQCQEDGIPLEECSLLKKVLNDIKSANFLWISVAITGFMISNISRALRWQQLFQSIGYVTKFGNSFWTIMIGYFANLGLPRAGEVARAASFSKYEKIGIEKVMGTVVSDRLVDLACLFTVTVLSCFLSYDKIGTFVKENLSNDSNTSGSNLKYYIVVVLVAVLIFFFSIRKKLAQIPVFKKIITLLSGFLQGIGSLTKVQNKPLFFLHTCIIWMMYFMMNYAMLKSFEPSAHLGLEAGLVVFVLGSLGILIPSPGGMGTYHYLVGIALSIYSISGDDGFSFANIAFFSINIFGNILFGLLGLIMLPLINRHYEPTRTTSL